MQNHGPAPDLLKLNLHLTHFLGDSWMDTKVGAVLVSAKRAQTWFKFWFCSLAAVQPWASYLIFLISGVFIFNLGINNAQVVMKH